MNLRKIPDKYKFLAVMLFLVVGEYLMANWKGLPFTWNEVVKWVFGLGFYSIYGWIGALKRQNEIHTEGLSKNREELARLHNALIDALAQIKGVLKAQYATMPRTKDVQKIFNQMVLEALDTPEGHALIRKILQNTQEPQPQNNSPPT